MYAEMTRVFKGAASIPEHFVCSVDLKNTGGKARGNCINFNNIVRYKSFTCLTTRNGFFGKS